MKLEKFTYSIIGFLIVCIAGFTLTSMMSLSVMQKLPQIGILRAIGMESKQIGYIFLFQAITTSIISSIIGILLTYYFIYLDNNFNFIHAIFPDALFFAHRSTFTFTTSMGLLLLLLSTRPKVKVKVKVRGLSTSIGSKSKSKSKSKSTGSIHIDRIKK